MSEAGATPSRETVLAALREVLDPELGYNVVDLGLVYRLEIGDGRVRAGMTMTTPGCPAQDYILSGVTGRLRQIPGVEAVDVALVWDPPWSPDRMSPAAKSFFGVDAQPRPPRRRDPGTPPARRMFSRLRRWLGERL